MGEQQSQKRGVCSEAQKTERARDGYEPIAPSNPVASAFGEHKGETLDDQELTLTLDERRRRRQEQNQE